MAFTLRVGIHSLRTSASAFRQFLTPRPPHLLWHCFPLCPIRTYSPPVRWIIPPSDSISTFTHNDAKVSVGGSARKCKRVLLHFARTTLASNYAVVEV